MSSNRRIALTGFMGVGKSSVARHLSNMCGVRRVDLDSFIETAEGRQIAEILDSDGEPAYRVIESNALAKLLETDAAPILSLGGGTWMFEKNRDLLRDSGYTALWLEASFEQCWLNIVFSRKTRPLARDRASAERLFIERQKTYCLAEWHFIVRPEMTSMEIARQIREEFFD
ncbi:MAG: shikimate kinase [Acidobacteria bacterium ACB1]|nr:Shikimate kinase [Pyrinomonadaceae bacterium]MCE7962249.1 shikimate kinase [Acidobacteria bacterium ACB1]RIJ93717.1 MAG: shikimate kinase [Acidobacteriota bacterium]